MDPATQFLIPGRAVTVRLAAGQQIAGRVLAVGDGWLQLETASQTALVNLAHVAAILGGEVRGADAPSAGDLPRPEPAEAPLRAVGKAPGRPWQDEELRQLADAFLDGKNDTELAARFNRTRGQVTELHRGFEVARGNLVEDQVSPVARSWVERWRRVLTR